MYSVNIDLIHQAEAELSDEKKREALDAALRAARVDTLKLMNLPTSISDDDHRLDDVRLSFKEKLRLRCKQILVEDEARRRL